MGLWLAGCAEHRRPILEKPEILHLVLIRLHSPGQAQELVDDTQEALGLSGSTRAVTPGVPFEMGRAEVDSDYDAAFVMEFKDAETYRRYLESPEHKRLVAKWKPRSASMRVFDMQRAYGDPWGPDEKRYGGRENRHSGTQRDLTEPIKSK